MALPVGLDARQAMAIGTAGCTAMLSMLALERADTKPDDDEVLVMGVSGGVDSITITLLDKPGYRVVALTGKTSETDFLQALDVGEMIDRAEPSAPDKPLQKKRWAAVVDSAGSHTLVNAYAQVRYGDVVMIYGLAQGMDSPTTVASFILRGATLRGIDSVIAPCALCKTAWQRLAADLLPGRLAAITREVALSEAIGAAHDTMAGKMYGWVVIDVGRQVGRPICG